MEEPIEECGCKTVVDEDGLHFIDCPLHADARRSVRESAAHLLAMLEKVMSELAPLKDPKHPGWETIEEFRRIIKESGGGQISDRRLWTALHSHKHGETVYVVESDHQPSEEELVKTLEIDFEPDRDETIEISSVKIDKIP